VVVAVVVVVGVYYHYYLVDHRHQIESILPQMILAESIWKISTNWACCLWVGFSYH
jgi:hypothetical protein